RLAAPRRLSPRDRPRHSQHGRGAPAHVGSHPGPQDRDRGRGLRARRRHLRGVVRRRGGARARPPRGRRDPRLPALAAGAPGGPPRRDRPPALMSTLPGAGGALIGLAAGWLGLAGLLGRQWTARIEWLVPLTGLELHMDPISGFFLPPVGATPVPASIYSLDDARGERKGLAAYLVFLLAMGVVPLAGNVPTFLLAWEIMALASYALVLHDHGAPGVVRAAWVYAGMREAGLASLLAGMLLMSATTGSLRFADWPAAGPRPDADTRHPH